MRLYSLLSAAVLCGGLAWSGPVGAQQAPAKKPAPTPAATGKPSAPAPTTRPASATPAGSAKPGQGAVAKPGAAKPATTAKPAAKPAAPAATKPATTARPATPVATPKPAAPTGPPLPANLGSADPATRYRNGKTLLDQTRYELALQELQPITAPGSQFQRAPEAAYLYAVAASRAKKWAEAEQMLNLLRTEYSRWPNLPEAFFLQGQVSFEQGDFDNALRVLSQLPPDQLTTERENMKAVYLPRVKDKATFQTLLKAYPQDAALARAYADKLANGGWYTEADKPQLDQLIAQFTLDRTRYTPRPRAQKKSTYNIGVLLPFEFDDPSWETRRKNQFVTDLYAGMRLAQDSLQREGRPVQLFAYDTGADTLQLKQVLTLPELAGMDMLIGPVYKSGSKILARYAQQKQIVVVNPLSQDGDLVLDNPWHYLFEPSTATQARLAAQFAFTRLGGARTAVVLYEDSKDEAAFGQAYKQAYEALGGRVLQLRRINSDVEESLASGFAGVDLKTVGHLVVASDAKKAGPYTLGVLKAQDARTPLITYASWLENNRIGLGQLDARDVYFVHPKFVDRTSPGARRVRQLYTQRQNLPPSVFALSGFELLYYFASQLHQHGPAFQQPLATGGPVSGTVFQGIGYPGGSHDNQYVPLTKLERLEVEVLNPVGIR
ncbi:ABC-type branched-subunit amino acid transport system substrate-binding protein/TolA-binding protein [Hymenobacter luteus]|uniref:ABC-type branched-subunit amino acid transport system substrate-binding protein/TolA-binding protein n=2 Tax=Hymenobacter TaxID=89966 RepID=A0A7W9SZZ7_9BACT|nr:MULTISPECIES: ABC transporter substrate-binding protein [Hymenobacter]MBB4601323.1 ABC-type branched-subunit amino acid transport system substrate-binding protein/TolA-binding protein [Hymenobacter latericoloratus]MBB6058470.1 ABC-type branched-subunit amino acid transport system substrate-binding protein/TolA-binding protein [Hymenobacter luteus]